MGLSNMGLGLAGIATFSALGRRYGKRTAMGCMQLSAIAVFIGTWWLYTPAVPWLQMVASGLIAFTGAGFWTLWSSMGADVIDYDELETGQRREGAFKACESWIMKLGLALGIGASGYILSGTGFDSRLEGAQTENALLNIRFYLAVIPVAGLLLAMGALARFGLTEQRMLEIRAQLEARRGAI